MYLPTRMLDIPAQRKVKIIFMYYIPREPKNSFHAFRAASISCIFSLPRKKKTRPCQIHTRNFFRSFFSEKVYTRTLLIFLVKEKKEKKKNFFFHSYVRRKKIWASRFKSKQDFEYTPTVCIGLWVFFSFLFCYLHNFYEIFMYFCANSRKI